MQGLTNSGTNF